MEFVVGAVVVLAIWMFVSFNSKKKAFAAHHAADEAAEWLASKGIGRTDLVFSTYTERRLMRNPGALLIVGNGKRNDSEDVGFVVEVVLPGRGVVEGELLVPWGTATWHRLAAETSTQTGKPMIDVLLERAHAHRQKHGIEEPK